MFIFFFFLSALYGQVIKLLGYFTSVFFLKSYTKCISHKHGKLKIYTVTWLLYGLFNILICNIQLFRSCILILQLQVPFFLEYPVERVLFLSLPGASIHPECLDENQYHHSIPISIYKCLLSIKMDTRAPGW